MSTTAPPQSMTGYAAASSETPFGRVAIELRSVNARFLDLSFRVPDELRAVEPGLRERIAGRLRRGKVECRVSYARAAAGDDDSMPDATALARLARLQDAVRAALPDAAPVAVVEALRWPGVLREHDVAESLQAAVMSLADGVLAEFTQARRREGQRTAAAVKEALAAMSAIVQRLQTRVPELVAQQQQRLVQRLGDALGSVAGGALAGEETHARVRQEITAHGLRADVAEELSRLEAHFAEVRRALDAGGPVGKRLDFLAQELNREANTLGAKAVALEITNASVELKLLIEQIREQAQNLE